MGIFLSILVLLLISSLIVAAIVIINPEITDLAGKQFRRREAITLEEALLGEIGVASFSGEWLPCPSGGDDGGDRILYDEAKNLNVLKLAPDADPQVAPVAAGGGTGDRQGNSSVVNTQPTLLKANISTLVANSSLLSSIDNQGYKLSPSGRYLLIWTAKKRQFRHTYTAKYFIYDTQTDLISLLGTTSTIQSTSSPSLASLYHSNQYEPIDTASLYIKEAYSSPLGQTPLNNIERNVRFQSVDWFASSISSSGNETNRNDTVYDSLVLIQNNDIYLLDNVTALGTHAPVIANDESVGGLPASVKQPDRLTFTGKQGEIFNGVADWLYEEEILADYQAYQVSPDGQMLAYMSFNDSRVTLMPFTVYGPSDLVIPKVQQIRYPKAGQVNPTVSVHVIDNLRDQLSRQDVELMLPADLSSEQHYIVSIRWLTNDKLAVIWLRREQNLAYVVICGRSSSSWPCEKNLKLEAPAKGWLEIGPEDIKPVDKNYYLILMLKHEGDDVGSFKHVARVAINGAPNSYTYLSSGRKEVIQIDGMNLDQRLVFFTSTLENEPGQRHFFVADLDWTSPNEQAEVCISCHHYPQDCLYNVARMSPSGRHYLFTCAGPTLPRTELRKCPLRAQIDFRRKRILPLSKLQQRRLQRSQIPLPNTKSSIQLVPVSSGGAINESKQLHRRDTAGAVIGSGRIDATTTPKPYHDDDDHHHQRDDYGDDDGIEPLSSSSGLASSESLLWVIEENNALRDKLQDNKAMPLNLRLEVPIPNTNYSANVLMLLPPLLGSTTSFARMAGGAASSNNIAINSNGIGGSNNAAINGPRIRKRSLTGQPGSINNNDQPTKIGSYYTEDTIQHYIDQLPQGQLLPMVVDVYGGPGSQRVDYRFGFNFGHYLASSQRTAYVLIDGRGSGLQGTKRLHELYHKLGTVEISDQIDVASYLSNKFSFIDANRVGIWGWSYGGYAAAMALAQSQSRAIAAAQSQFQAMLKNNTQSSSGGGKYSPNSNTSVDLSGNDKIPLPSLSYLQQPPKQIASRVPSGVFECAASVAPVTNWIYYDTAYTERYMSSPYMNGQYDWKHVGDHLSQNAGGLDQTADVKYVPNQQQIANTWQRLNQSSMQNSAQTSLYQLMFRSYNNRQSTNISQQHSNQTTNPNSSTMPRYNLGPIDLNQHYRTASLLENIKFIDRKKFMLIHGTADDNVHFQQSIMLMKQLIHRSILYESRFYPDQDHRIGNRADKLHLGSVLTHFFAECFDMLPY